MELQEAIRRYVGQAWTAEDDSATAQPYFCPWCGSEAILTAWHEAEFFPNEVFIPVDCLDCGAGWEDIYRLRAITWVDSQGVRHYSDEQEEPTEAAA